MCVLVPVVRNGLDSFEVKSIICCVIRVPSDIASVPLRLTGTAFLFKIAPE